MIEIIPAIIPKNREDIENAVLRYVETPIQTLQIDLVDGQLAQPKSWPYNSKNQYEEYKFLEEEGFPGWQDIDIELDLMIENPLDQIQKFIAWGPARIIIHTSSVDNQEFLTFLKNHNSERGFIDFGIAFGIDDTISNYKEILQEIDFVQCMGIAEIGSQGKNFDPRVFSQIQKVREIAPNLPISVDGAVSPEVSKELITLGVSRLVSGSFLAKSLDIIESMKELTGIIEGE